MLLQVIIILFAAFALSRSYLRYRKNTESLLEFLLWIVVWVSVVVVVLVRRITAIPAQIFGIGRGVDVLVYLSIVFLIYSVYRIYSKIEKLEQDMTKLTREIALRQEKKK